MCVNAARSHDWEELINVWGNMRLSPSQMFHILIVFYYFCEDTREKQTTLKVDAESMLLATSYF